MPALHPTSGKARLAALALCAALSGCSLLDSGPESLAFEPLLDSATFVEGRGLLGLYVLESDEDEAAFRRETRAGAFPRDIDYRRESVVGVIFGASEPGGRVSIQSMTLDGDQIAFEIASSGSIGTPDGTETVAYPASFVTTRRGLSNVHGATYAYPGRDF